MSEDRRDVLEVLRYELNFLEQGGYTRNLRQGREISPFLDTLSCLNFGEPFRKHTCQECVLYDFVPEESRTEEVPCHFIPLDEAGMTVSKLLKVGNLTELETALRSWLRNTITALETKQAQLSSDSE